MNGDPRGVCQEMRVDVTSPDPPGWIASVGPARPEGQKTSPCPTAGVGITSMVGPWALHNSFPLSGLYARTAYCPLTTISSRAPLWMAIGVPQPTPSCRGVFQTSLPVLLSIAATNDRLR